MEALDMMDDLSSVPIWDPTAMAPQPSWEDMLNDLLQEPDTDTAAAGEAPAVNGTTPSLYDHEDLLGLVEGNFDGSFDGNFEDPMANEGGPQSVEWWTAAAAPVAVDASALDGIDFPDLCNTFLVEEDVSLPGLSSEVSSFADEDRPLSDGGKTSEDAVDEIRHDVGVISSPGSCNRAESEADCRPSSNNSEDEVGNVSSRSHSPIGIVTSCSELKAASPDTGSGSSDVGALGRSCDNFADQSTDRRGDSSPGEIDEDAKRQSRLIRNRESATQSRLRKKSYMKDLEAKCRAMESQLSMLHQTVAFTSAQNAALREELAHVKCLKSNGSKSGATEPAALPSDSLPSESPSRHTSPCLSVKWELVAFLCHVLLLTLLQALPLKLAASGGNTPSKARSERRANFSVTCPIQRLGMVGSQFRKPLCTFNWRRRPLLTREVLSHRNRMTPGTSRYGRASGRKPSKHKSSANRHSRPFSRRSQYCSFP